MEALRNLRVVMTGRADSSGRRVATCSTAAMSLPVRLAERSRSRTILFTGVTSRCGTSTVVANVAALLADIGCRVVVVDAAIEAPSLHEVFGTSQTPGLLDSLSCALAPDSLPTAKVRHGTDEAGGLWVLPVGTFEGRSRPNDILAGRSTQQLLQTLVDQFDMVVIDAVVCAGIVVGAHAGGSRRRRLRRSRERDGLSGTIFVWPCR